MSCQRTVYFQVRELEILLLHLADVGHVLSSKEYIAAWESVLFTPFLNGKLYATSNLVNNSDLQAKYKKNIVHTSYFVLKQSVQYSYQDMHEERD
jgi:hypothetical protein